MGYHYVPLILTWLSPQKPFCARCPQDRLLIFALLHRCPLGNQEIDSSYLSPRHCCQQACHFATGWTCDAEHAVVLSSNLAKKWLPKRKALDGNDAFSSITVIKYLTLAINPNKSVWNSAGFTQHTILDFMTCKGQLVTPCLVSYTQKLPAWND